MIDTPAEPVAETQQDDERRLREQITEALRGYAPESVRADVCGMAVRAVRAALDGGSQ